MGQLRALPTGPVQCSGTVVAPMESSLRRSLPDLVAPSLAVLPAASSAGTRPSRPYGWGSDRVSSSTKGRRSEGGLWLVWASQTRVSGS